MERQIVLNNFQKTNISVITFFIGLKNDLFTNLLVTMVTKFNCMILYDFVAIETTVVPNNFANLLLLTPSILG